MSAENQYVVVLCTCPDDETGATIAARLVDEGLAACVSRVPEITSTFRWEGRIEEEQEVLLVIKSAATRVDELAERIRTLHPYELPEVIAVPVCGGLDGYLAWIGASLSPET